MGASGTGGRSVREGTKKDGRPLDCAVDQMELWHLTGFLSSVVALRVVTKRNHTAAGAMGCLGDRAQPWEEGIRVERKWGS